MVAVVIAIVTATRRVPEPSVEGIDKAAPAVEPDQALAPRVVSPSPSQAVPGPTADADSGSEATPPHKPARWPAVRPKTSRDRAFDHQ